MKLKILEINRFCEIEYKVFSNDHVMWQIGDHISSERIQGTIHNKQVVKCS